MNKNKRYLENAGKYDYPPTGKQTIPKLGYSAPSIDISLSGSEIEKPIYNYKKIIYGSNKDVRNRVRETYPQINRVVDSVANAYDLTPAMINYRLDHEGFTDHIAKLNDEQVEDLKFMEENGLIPDPHFLIGYGGYGFPTDGFESYGLDDVADLIKSGKVKLINEKWKTAGNINEKGRMVHSATGDTWIDNVGILAATLKYYRELAKKDFPGETEEEYDRLANAYFHRGASGGRTWGKGKREGYDIKKLGGSVVSKRKSLRNESIYIK